MRLRSLILPTLAVLFAFGMGIALGAGPLHGVDADTPTGPPVSRPTPNAHFPDDAMSAAASTLYAGGLTGQSVAIVSLSGSSSATIAALRGQIEAAGGTVASQTTIGIGLTTPGNKALVDTLGTQLVQQLPGIVDPDASTYKRIGELIGYALATTTTVTQPTTPEPSASGLPSPTVSTTTSAGTTPSAGAPQVQPSGASSTPAPPASSATGSPTPTLEGSPAPVDPAVAIATIRQSLATAGLTSQINASAPLAPMVVVVTGHRVDPPIISGLVAGIASKAHNVAGIGKTRDADLASLRTAKVPVVTIDGDESTAGRVAAVLALIQQLTSGSFGASGPDGPLPPLPTATLPAG